MNLKSALTIVALLSVLIVFSSSPARCEKTMYLNVCQELVNQARAYEARANYHNQMCKAYMLHIENLAKLAKNSATSQAMDSFFSQYDQNRELESKFRELYRQASEEAKRCMKSAE